MAAERSCDAIDCFLKKMCIRDSRWPMRLENSNRAMALGEQFFGSGVGYHYFILSLIHISVSFATPVEKAPAGALVPADTSSTFQIFLS